MRGDRRSLALLVLATLALQAGCQGLLFSAMYLWKGNNAPADFDGLKEKKVVVVCRPLQELGYRVSGAPNEIARGVAGYIEKNVKKCKVVPQQEVSEWVDENRWDDYPEIGRAVEADMVVGIDLLAFSLLQSQTVYQGKAVVRVTVYDMSKEGEVVFEKDFPRHVFPPNAGIYANDMSEDQFRRKYVEDLAADISVLFYPHDVHHGFAKDSSTIE
jgi:hypothetical protein